MRRRKATRLLIITPFGVSLSSQMDSQAYFFSSYGWLGKVAAWKASCESGMFGSFPDRSK